MTTQSAAFKSFTLPTGEQTWIPSDLHLELPETATIDRDLLHHLISIPWEDRYLERVDPAYRDFFCVVLPFLHVRTTDVHVATCLPYARELIDIEREPVDERVVHFAFILHDAGWSQMTDLEIAGSLGVEGLALSGTAVGPKARHAELGRDLAQRILTEHPPQPRLTSDQEAMIFQAILYHDRPQQLTAMGNLPASIRVVCDVDHLWSFTHENFWQDTVRKGVDPRQYLDNLGTDLEGYFVGEPAKRKARQMLDARLSEVEAWAVWPGGDRD